MSDSKILRMASTTSTDNTGLLAYLASLFEKEHGIRLQWVATGTGRALELGKHCDVDILLVHAPEAEQKFVNSSFGVRRMDVMYNDFVLAGPPGDPAQVGGLDIAGALGRIFEKKAVFVSRSDDSGTHKKEQALWKTAGLDTPEVSGWYVQANKGMHDTLELAASREGYVLTDRGTLVSYLASAASESLKILVEGSEQLRNQYGVIAVNPKTCPHARHELAEEFITWITSERGQSAIENFRLQGQQLFTPNAGGEEADS